MQIYNTLTRKKEEFVPRNDKKVQMFVCGPTVYDYPHIGHAKTAIFFDAFAKYLRYKDYEVDYIQNITDIDDKIIRRAEESGTTPKELAEKFTKIYTDDMAALGIDNSNIKYAKATDYIKEIINQVKALIEKDFAYEIPEDGWYYDISKFKDYGKLSNRTAEQAEDAVSRIDEAVGKRNKGDFCLWKFSKPSEPVWQADIGDGRPGWHIEDTAITGKEFGPHYDIHGGASELKFPHHEAEIAQVEALYGPPLVKYWIHTGLLTINGQKMSKSLGNFVTIRDVLKNYSSEVVRFMILSHAFGSPMDFTESGIKSAAAAIMRIAEFRNKFALTPPKQEKTALEGVLETIKNKIEEALDNNFNTPEAFSALFDSISQFNKSFSIGEWDMAAIKKAREIIMLLNILGIVPSEYSHSEIPEEIKNLVNKRQEMRENKDFSSSDKIRAEIESRGYQIDDTPYGPLITKK